MAANVHQSILFTLRNKENDAPPREYHFAACYLPWGEQGGPSNHLQQLDQQVRIAYPQLANKEFSYIFQVSCKESIRFRNSSLLLEGIEAMNLRARMRVIPLLIEAADETFTPPAPSVNQCHPDCPACS